MAIIMAIEIFLSIYCTFPSFLPSSIIHILQDLDPQQDQGLAPIQKPFSGRFPGHHLRIICSGYAVILCLPAIFNP